MRNFAVTADRIFAIPGWILMRIILELVKHHPYHTRRFTLQDWSEHRTNDMRAFDLCFWVLIFTLACVIPHFFFK